ncbi:ABC-F family ATP-binding cassette domain-containing protein [Roseivirga sp. BDSF3-8]|uniref:ABC-F family ATP-binding cassette domain-containing protein n=1 Tax=Roseivirga sp. BDSF3-8 TaxID=3241598 RepID=UPI0035326618
MNFLSVESITKSFGERMILDGVTFGLSQGQKTALVGINGSGKSTLLKILSGEMKPDSGEVSFRNDLRVAYLAQNPPMNEEATIMDEVFDDSDPVVSLVREYEYHLHRSVTDTDSQEKLTELIPKMDELGAWDYEVQAKQILGRLGLYDLDKKVGLLSGGQRKRVAMARVLMEKPDLVIMDEPTNHLDLESIEWLEAFLASSQMSLLLVTHDRYFLERVTDHIIELDEGKVHTYKGNYNYFLEKKAERIQQEVAEADKARNLMRKELEWMRRQPKARGTKAKYRVDAFYDLKDKAGNRPEERSMTMNIGTERQGKKILEVKHLNKQFGDLVILDDFNYVFRKNERIGIVGKNGTGKSTFLNILTEREQPDSGELDKGHNTKYGYYTQEADLFDDDQRVIDTVQEVADIITMSDGHTITASQLLQHFMFPPKKQYDKVGKLSGGEKRRLQLLRTLMSKPNFLILDEPTNDLDLLTLNVLEEFLDNYDGCLMVVSHDRYFLDKLTDHLFVFEGDAEIRDFPGNYTDYREFRKLQEHEKEPKADNKPQKEAAKPSQTTTEENKKLSYKEKREFEQLEADIPKLEKEKAGLIQKINSGEEDYEKLTGWSQELETLQEQLDEKELRWLELSERT